MNIIGLPFILHNLTFSGLKIGIGKITLFQYEKSNAKIKYMLISSYLYHLTEFFVQIKLQNMCF